MRTGNTEPPRDPGARAAIRGDRHLSADPGGALETIPPGESHVVRLSAPHSIASTAAGQHTLWMATNLLARQFGIIGELRIAVPAVDLRPSVGLLGEYGDLATTLVSTARSISADLIHVTTAPEGDEAPAAVEVVVGNAADSLSPDTQPRVAVLGAGWSALVGTSVVLAPEEALLDPNPFGPYSAACLGAGEVFKRLVGVRPGKGRLIETLALSLWDFREHESWESMPAGITPSKLSIPPFYLVGAGAVGQAVAAVLAAAHVQGHATVIDNDTVDDTNGNRCVLVTDGDEGKAKAPLAAAVLRAGGLTAFAFEGTWQNYVFNLPHEGQLPPLRSREAAYEYELVLSCVDKNTARHAIQNIWPRYLMGGSTDGLAVQVTAYDMLSPYECLKCANPLEVGAGTIEEVANQLRGLPLEERRARLEARGLDVEAIERYLNDPRCGELGERELSKFVTSPGDHDWSVGFVSAAAGVLLGAQLVKYAAVGGGVAFPSEEGHTLRFNFLRPAPKHSLHRRIEGCSCTVEGRADWASMWA